MNPIDDIGCNTTNARGKGQKGSSKDGLNSIADHMLVYQFFLGLTGCLNFL